MNPNPNLFRLSPAVLQRKLNINEFLQALDSAREGLQEDFLGEYAEDVTEEEIAYMEQPLQTWLSELLGNLQEGVEFDELPPRPERPPPRHGELHTAAGEYEEGLSDILKADEKSLKKL